MADQNENININVQATGIDTVEGALQAMGLTGDAATERIASGFQRTSTSAQTASNIINILAQAMKAGVDDTDALEAALQAMTAGEVSAAAKAQTLTQSIVNFGAAAAAAAAQANQQTTATNAAATATANLGNAAVTTTAKVAQHTTAVNTTNTSLTNAAKYFQQAGLSAGGFGQSMFSLSGILQAAAGYLSISAYVSASDAFTKLSNQIKQVTTSGDQFNQVMGQLHTIADATGTSVDATGKLFFNMANAAKGTTVSVQQMTDAITTIQSALYASGATGAEASRVVKELGESFAKGELNGRQFLSILTQAPAVVAQLAAGLGTTTQALTVAIEAQKQHGDAAQVAADKVASASKAAEQSELSYTKLSQSLQQAQRGFSDLTASGKFQSESFQQQQEQRLQYQQKISNQMQELDIADQSRTQASAKAAAAQATATAGTIDLSFANIINAFAKQKQASQDLAATMQGTISGALTALSNDWTFYVGQINTATNANNIIRQGILTLGQNLDAVIPIVALFVGSFVLAGAISAVNSLVLALTGIATVLNGAVIPAIVKTATVMFTLFLNPVGLAIGVVALAIGAFIAVSGGIGPAWTNAGIVVNSVLSFMGSLIAGVGNAISVVASFVGGAFTAVWNVLAAVFTPVWNILSFEVNGALTDLQNLWTWLSTVFAPVWKTISDAFTPVWNLLSDFVNRAMNDFDNFIGVIKDVITWINNLFAANENTAKSFDDEATASAKVSAAPLGHARDGMNMVVGGGTGGTDNKLLQMLVSPGERVIVQTPAQQGHYDNTKIPRFAAGGDIGITGGLEGVTINQLEANATSVTGYSPAAQTVTAAQIAANIVALNSGYAPTASGGSAVSASNTNTSAAAANSAVNQQPSDVVAQWQTIFDAYQTDLISENIWKNIPGSNVVDSWSGINDGLYLTGSSYRTIDGSGTHNTSSRSQADDINMNYARKFGAQSWSAERINLLKSQILASDQDWTAGGKVAIGLGFKVSSGPSSSGRSAATSVSGSASKSTNDNSGVYNVVASTIAKPANFSPGTFASGANTALNSSNSYFGSDNDTSGSVTDGSGISSLSFRDGGDFTVPGTGGVDNRTVQMNVSPGEHVSVKTPQQQDAAGDAGVTHVHFNSTTHITTPNTESLRRSQPQLDRENQSRLNRMAQRIRS